MEKKYVLIADDEEDVRQILREIVLEMHPGFCVLEAENGSEAIRKLKLQKFALAIVDLKMPKLDGFTVLSGIKSLSGDYQPEHTLVVSGISNAQEIRDQFGAYYIAKPFRKEHIQSYMRKIFEVRRKEADGKPESPSKGFDLAVVNAFINGTIQVLETMAQTPAVKDSLYVRDPDAVSGDISAILAIHSTKSRGSLAISFGKSCFLAIVNRMLGESYTEITAENADAAAELCNQIFGVAKKEINSSGNDLQPAIPSVVTGEAHKIQHKTTGPCVVVRFKTDAGYFTIETVMEAAQMKSNAAA